MTATQPRRKPRRGRIFPEYTIPPEELARREEERDAFYRICYAVFERVRPALIAQHYNWFIIIEPNSGDYFIDPDEDVAEQKARQMHPRGMLGTFCINETGACGRL